MAEVKSLSPTVYQLRDPEWTTNWETYLWGGDTQDLSGWLWGLSGYTVTDTPFIPSMFARLIIKNQVPCTVTFLEGIPFMLCFQWQILVNNIY